MERPAVEKEYGLSVSVSTGDWCVLVSNFDFFYTCNMMKVLGSSKSDFAGSRL